MAIPKTKRGKPERPISLFCVQDRVVMRALLQQLWPLIEPHIMPNVAYCTFRKDGLHPPRGVERAILALREARRDEPGWVFKTDIEGFYDAINRQKLSEFVRRVLGGDSSVDALLNAYLECETILDPTSMSTIEFDQYAGLAQGAALSPLLACGYLSAFDRRMRRWLIIRYVDDIVVVCRDRATCDRARKRIFLLLKDLDLRLKPEKTVIRSPSDSVEYLGVILRHDGLIRPGEKRIANLTRALSECVRHLRKRGNGRVARELLSLLKGFYHSMVFCHFNPSDHRKFAKSIKRAIRRQGLPGSNLIQLVIKQGHNLPKEFIEELSA